MYDMLGRCPYGETGKRLTRRKASYVIGLGSILAFLSWSWGGSKAKKIQKLSVIDQILTILDWLMPRLWVKVLLSYMVWSLSICIASQSLKIYFFTPS